jgi:hypothetical protein
MLLLLTVITKSRIMGKPPTKLSVNIRNIFHKAPPEVLDLKHADGRPDRQT